MNNESLEGKLVTPYGGKLIDLLTPIGEREELRRRAEQLRACNSLREICAIWNCLRPGLSRPSTNFRAR